MERFKYIAIIVIAIAVAIFAVATRFMIPGWLLVAFGGFIFVPAIACVHCFLTYLAVQRKVMTFRQLVIMQLLFVVGALLQSDTDDNGPTRYVFEMLAPNLLGPLSTFLNEHGMVLLVLGYMGYLPSLAIPPLGLITAHIAPYSIYFTFVLISFFHWKRNAKSNSALNDPASQQH